MAWAFVSAGTADADSYSNAITPSFPASIAAGDILIYSVIGTDSATRWATPPSGFTEIYAPASCVAIFAKVATGSESGTLSLASTAGSAGFHRAAICRFTGGSEALGSIVHASDFTYAAGVADIDTDALTVTQPGCLILYVGGKRRDGGLTDPPNASTSAHHSTSADPVLLSIAYEIQTSAANVSASTFDLDIETTANTVSATVALRAAAVVTITDDTLETGGTIAVTADPAFGASIDAANIDSDSLVVSSADADSANIAIPAIAEFVSGGDAEHIRLNTSVTLTVKSGAASATDTLTISPPSGYFIATLAEDYDNLSADVQAYVPSGAVTGDDLMIRAVSGASITDLSEYGELQMNGPTAVIESRLFDVSAPGWTAATEYDWGAEEPVQTVTPDAAYYHAGGSIVFTLDPVGDEAPNSATIDDVDASADLSSSTTAGATLAAPALADFLTGAHNATPWYSPVYLVVGFATNDDATAAEVAFVGPAGSNVSGATHWYGVVPTDPSGVLSDAAEGETYLFIVTRGTLVGFNEVEFDASEDGTADYWRFTSGAWTNIGTVAFEKTTTDWDYPGGGKSRFDDDGMLAADDAVVVRFVEKFLNEVIA